MAEIGAGTGDIAFENMQVGPAERLCDPDDSVWRFIQRRLGTNLQGFLARADIDEHFQHDMSKPQNFAGASIFDPTEPG